MNGFVSRVLQIPTQIDKTVKIFENVAFSGEVFFKSIYLLQARNILDIVSASYSLCHSFYHFIKHRPENKVLNLSSQNEIDIIYANLLNSISPYQ